MRIFDTLKKVMERQGLEIIDINDYEEQPNFKKEFDKLTKGRKVSIAFVSNKINNVIKKGDIMDIEKVVDNVCKNCPTNDFKQCEKDFDCWIRNAIKKGSFKEVKQDGRY